MAADDRVADTEAVTLGEIGRLVGDVRDEMRAIRTEVVRQDVYTANRATDDLRMKAVEASITQMQDSGRSVRLLVYAALMTAGGGIAVDLLGRLIDIKR